MSDTQRTRSSLLALFADNVTGQISEQDFRDFVVTVMNTPEFAYEGDFWCGPNEQGLIVDKTVRGWCLYSQNISSKLVNGVSFGQVYCKTASNTWSTANVSNLACNRVGLGVPADSYAKDTFQAKMLVWGVVYNSSMSIRTASCVGYPVYLQSELDCSISVTAPTNLKIVGYVLPSGQVTSYAYGSGKWFFDPSKWSVVGV